MRTLQTVQEPRTLDEIGEASRTGRKEIGRTYRFMVRELKMKIPPTKPEDYIPRFCSGLDLDAEVQAKAYELISAAQEKELTSGRGPTGIAAPDHIHRKCPLWQEENTERGGGGCRCHRGHHQEPLQGAYTESQHRA